MEAADLRALLQRGIGALREEREEPAPVINKATVQKLDYCAFASDNDAPQLRTDSASTVASEHDIDMALDAIKAGVMLNEGVFDGDMPDADGRLSTPLVHTEATVATSAWAAAFVLD